MSNNEILNFQTFNPFQIEEEDNIKTINKTKITIHVKKRLANKYFTQVYGLESDKYNNFIKTVKKKFSCNGAIVEDTNSGKDIIQFNGNHKMGIFQLLVDLKYAEEDDIKLRGI